MELTYDECVMKTVEALGLRSDVDLAKTAAAASDLSDSAAWNIAINSWFLWSERAKEARSHIDKLWASQPTEAARAAAAAVVTAERMRAIEARKPHLGAAEAALRKCSKSDGYTYPSKEAVAEAMAEGVAADAAINQLRSWIGHDD